MWTRTAPDGPWSHSQQKPVPFLQITYPEFYISSSQKALQSIQSLTNDMIEEICFWVVVLGQIACTVLLFWYIDSSICFGFPAQTELFFSLLQQSVCYDVPVEGFDYSTHRQMTFSWHIDLAERARQTRTQGQIRAYSQALQLQQKCTGLKILLLLRLDCRGFCFLCKLSCALMHY